MYELNTLNNYPHTKHYFMTESFYTSIATHYQHIFPLNSQQIDFLRLVLPYNGARVLDVGCATGDLAFALAHFGFPIWGIDFDDQMIRIAQNTKSEEVMFPVFGKLDMRFIDQQYPESFFDTIICFGNTLVHLLTDEDIQAFINAAFKTLAPEGKLTIQILNYKYILNKPIKSLPIIENEHVRFERNYEFTNDSDVIDFNTTLTLKPSGQEIKNTVKLYAITQSKLQEMLKDAGFGAFEFYGSFAGEPLQENSLPLIITCQKAKE